ncbi:hypothetical protein BC936DRAFT_139329 [Jimgerdemannia flammicorona]|uniref:AIG1-type G domain-containing protein n=1 Tax=Jimgerdemannia flammicorona TaxID=994334 RepID=A0A433BA43_9FUNG|nr:hypothetical protein BC936DRAFT_139329 [Jimgerdemannia flammicorona]
MNRHTMSPTPSTSSRAGSHSPPPYNQANNRSPPDPDRKDKYEYPDFHDSGRYECEVEYEVHPVVDINGPPPPVPPHQVPTSIHRNPFDVSPTELTDKLLVDTPTKFGTSTTAPMPIPNGPSSNKMFYDSPSPPPTIVMSPTQFSSGQPSPPSTSFVSSLASFIPSSHHQPKQPATTPFPTPSQSKPVPTPGVSINRINSSVDHVVMVPLGKTGQGKSSLLNSIFGYDEFHAAAKVKSVTEDVTERTGYWQVDRKKILATVADTPGFADTDGRDAIFIPRIRNYIVSLSRRVGIDAFMMVFKINMGG